MTLTIATKVVHNHTATGADMYRRVTALETMEVGEVFKWTYRVTLRDARSNVLREETRVVTGWEEFKTLEAGDWARAAVASWAA